MYRAVHTFYLNYEDQSINAVSGQNNHWFWDSYKIFSKWRSAV